MIKVLIIEDSTFLRKAVCHMLSFDPEIEVVGEAGDGREALEKVMDLKPDVITMDIIMPGTDGLWALEEIMKQRPTPVVIVSSIVAKNSDVVTEAFSLGVVDVVAKPENPQQIPLIQREMIGKIKAAAKINRLKLIEYRNAPSLNRVPSRMVAHQVVVIATSAGGPTSLYEVIQRFSENFYGGIVVAQHMPSNFIHSFVGHIQTRTSMTVKLATKGEMLYSRKVLFSPTNATLELHRTKKGGVSNIVDYKNRLQPDIDRVIISCAEAFKSSMVLVVLSGLGSDSVKGAEAVKKYGGKVIVEDQSTAGVYSGMPFNVVKSGFYDISCPSYSISEVIENHFKNKSAELKVPQKHYLIKGVLISNTLQYMRSNCPPDVYARITSGLTREVADEVARGIRPNNYYPSEIYYELFGCLDKEYAKKREIVDEIIYANALESLRMYKNTLAIGNIQDFVGFLAIFYKVVFPGVLVETRDITYETNIVTIAFKSDGYTEKNAKQLKRIMPVWFTSLLRVLELEFEKCNVSIEHKGKDVLILVTIKLV